MTVTAERTHAQRYHQSAVSRLTGLIAALTELRAELLDPTAGTGYVLLELDGARIDLTSIENDLKRAQGAIEVEARGGTAVRS